MFIVIAATFRSISSGTFKRIVLSIYQDPRVIILALALLLGAPTKDYQVVLKILITNDMPRALLLLAAQDYHKHDISNHETLNMM